MILNKRHLPFYLLTLSVFVVLIIPTLIQDGMFMDGLQYACVSKNLADGLGSFWFPHLSATWVKAGSPYFLEHPPLVYGMQSLLFKLLGDTIYIERLYSLLTAIITAYIIALTWKLIYQEDLELKQLSWLPILFWIIIPVGFWSYQNNMQENTMGLFTLSSVYFTLKGLSNKRHIFIYLLLSGTFIFLASLSKGLPGLFPIVVVGLYWLVHRTISLRMMVTYSLVLILLPVLFYSLLLLDNEAYRSLTFYFNERVLHRIQDNPTVESHFYIVYRLVTELLPPLLITLGLLVLFRLKSIQFSYNRKHMKSSHLFLLIGISGSLPLILTPVQKGFYLVAAFPFFAFAFALIVAPSLNELVNRMDVAKRSFTIFKTVSVVVLIVSALFSGLQGGKVGRDHDTLHDVYLIGEVLPRSSVIKIEDSMYAQWGLQFYLIRHFNISVDVSDNQYAYYLVKKEAPNLALKDHKKVPLMTKKYDLYQLK